MYTQVETTSILYIFLLTTEVEPALEPCPKWTALLDILKEIRDDIKHADLDQCHVLIAAEDDRTCNQIREVDHNYIVLQLQWNLSDPTRQEAREMCRILQDVRILRFNLVNINTLGP